MSRILIVGDPHAHPDYDNDRFEWLGNYITETLPDHVVVMGDWGDFPSLTKLGKPIEHEGLRLSADVAALHDSRKRLQAPIDAYNRRRRAARQGSYRPDLHYILGNHEDRAKQYEADHPELEGFFDEWMEPFARNGWQITAYKDSLILDGYEFSHHFTVGTSGRPIGGKTGTALAMRLTQRHVSSVVGHDHRFGIASDPAGRRRVWGINAGCMMHPDYREPWALQTEPLWDRGVLLLDGCRNGDHSHHTWTTQEELRRRYGR